MRTLAIVFALSATQLAAEPLSLGGRGFRVLIDPARGAFTVEDLRSGSTWTAGPFQVKTSGGPWTRVEGPVTAEGSEGMALSIAGEAVTIRLALTRGKRSLEVSWTLAAGKSVDEVQLLPPLSLAPEKGSFLVVPVREGLLVPADEGPAFERTFGTSEYEGCHQNVIGLADGSGAALITWDDAYVSPGVSRKIDGNRRTLSVEVRARRSARSLLFTPVGKGGLDELAAAYREIAEEKGLRKTLRSKMADRPALERLVGATNFKLWTCLNRKMNADSTKEESVEVQWTFPEAAQVAEHLKRDLEIDRCLFTLGGWIHRGYDCQHPDVLPAAPECGGNEALASALGSIRALGYADSLHDNYQDIYRDSPSWSESLVMKRSDGALAVGGEWLGGRAYLVCAPKSLELARRPGNLAEVKRLFQPLTYFIDTTYAVGPQECHDPNHPLTRNDDIRWKIALSDYSRDIFGVFGSECGREWAIPHSDFFEGIVGVGGKYFHNLDPAALGAIPIPFFEMVYHDCTLAWGKYEFDLDGADETVLHHVACARPLYFHAIPKGLYWKRLDGDPPATGSFTRADGGWAKGLCQTDRLLKNTHEILGPLHRETAHLVLTRLEFLSADRSLRRMTWGDGNAIVTCNFGEEGPRVTSPLVGDLVLPRWGFLVESPRFLAFHAVPADDPDSRKSVLFTLTSLDGKPLAESKRIRVFHGFGGPVLAIGGTRHSVEREAILEPTR